MSEIPKRPDYFDAVFLAIGTGLMPEAKCLHYEHAVAKVAVAALREIAENRFQQFPDGRPRVSDAVVRVTGEALAKIEASGWRP